MILSVPITACIKICLQVGGLEGLSLCVGEWFSLCLGWWFRSLPGCVHSVHQICLQVGDILYRICFL
jgi:hypothetical protein